MNNIHHFAYKIDMPIICPYLKWWANPITWPNTKSQAEPIDPNTDAALPCCRATDTCWRRRARALTSCVTARTHLVISANRSRASMPKAPEVFTTTGTKWWVRAMISYLLLFLISACPATAHASITSWARWDKANVSMQETSQTSMRPDFHGAIVTPAIRSLAVRPTEASGFQHGGDLGWWQSSLDDIINCSMTWLTSSTPDATEAMNCLLIHWCAAKLASMRAAQGAPRRRPTAILTTSSSMRRPRLEAGTAFNKEPDSLVAAARSLARVLGSVASLNTAIVPIIHIYMYVYVCMYVYCTITRDTPFSQMLLYNNIAQFSKHAASLLHK